MADRKRLMQLLGPCPCESDVPEPYGCPARKHGEWGIEGVDLSTLPPKVYTALCKLKDLEHGG